MKTGGGFITLDQVSPMVYLASCYHLTASYWHRYRVPSHHLLLLESGTIRARTPSGSLVAHAGDLICFRPTTRNEYGHAGPTLLYQIHVQFASPPRDRCTPVFDEFGPFPVHLALGNAFDEVRRVFETLCIEITRDGAVHRQRQRAAVHELLAIVTSVMARQPTGRPKMDKWLRLRLKLEAGGVVAGESGGEFNVNQLAREMGLSRTYFTRAFRKNFGVSPRAYQTRARLLEAARLIRTTDRPIKAIAFDVGFTTPKLFTRLCRRHLGVLPTALRLVPRDRAGVSEKLLPLEGKLFPVNEQLLPPRAPANWFKRYYPWLRSLP